MQEVAYSRGGCNLKCALKGSGDITSMVPICIKDGSPVLPDRMLSGRPERWFSNVAW